MTYLIEKSPQSMLKSSLYREIFKYAKSIRFVILIKVNQLSMLNYMVSEVLF